MKRNKTLLFSFLTLLCFALNAQNTAPGIVKAGDKLFSKYKYAKAMKVYQAALASKQGDSLYIMGKLGDAAKLSNNPALARVWYSRVVKNPKANAAYKLQYAQSLRQAGEYVEAKKWYEEYRKSYPADGNAEDIIKGLDKVKEMQKDNGNGYKIEPMQFNSGKSDISAFYIGRDTMLFLSNRKTKQKTLSDNSAGNNYYNVYRAAGNGLTVSTSKYKVAALKKPLVGNMSYNAGRKELIIARSNKTCGTPKSMKSKKGVYTQLYTVNYPSSKKAKPYLLPFNGNNFNNMQPSLSNDGNTLYFVSDRPGGYGGTDIYVCKRVGQSWGAPTNLGPEINSKYEEKYPFIADDGTLYFSSTGYAGLGGLDIYSSTNQNGKWSKPTNLGSPVNTNADDFNYIVDTKRKMGFLVSNSPGSFGGDDIYRFTYKDLRKWYPVTVRVLDAETNDPIPSANISVPCTVDPTSSILTDMNGEGRFNIGMGMTCDVTAAMLGYAPAKAGLKADDKGIMVVTMKKQPLKLQATIKDINGGQVVRDVNIKITAQNDNTSKILRTDGNGNFIADLNNAVTYIISSPDFKEIADTIRAGASTDNVSLNRTYSVTYENRKINVPLAADCFQPNSLVTITNIGTNETLDSKVGADGKVSLALTPNTAYSIKVDGKTETFSTGNLHPGDVITLSCKFTVGETWVLRNIYYDLAKFNIRPDAAKELDRLITVMKNNPTLEIELGSHTDCRQTAAYNNMLSAQRAKAAVDYIGQKISKKRLLSAGYGESKLVNECACEPTNDSPCTDEQHQANRRTEVKVLKY